MLFWHLTYREMAAILDGARGRIVREQNDQMTMAWHIEALARSKKMPRLAAMLKKVPAKTAKKTDWKDQFAAFSAWAGSFKASASPKGL